MPRLPEPVQILQAKGKARLTKAEIAERLEREQMYRGGTDKIACPSWLDEFGQEEWERIVAELTSLGLMTNIDVTALAMYCDAVSHYRAVSRNRQKANEAIKWAQVIRQFLAEFGLTPAARLKLTPPKQKEKPKTAFEKKFGNV